MKYYTRYNRYISPHCEYTEQASLVGDDVKELSTKEMIAKFLDSQPQGMMTEPGDYDWPPNTEKKQLMKDTEGYWDPTKERGYDMFQAQQDLKSNRLKLKDAQKQAELEAKVAAATSADPDTADIAPPSPKDPAGGLNG